MGFNPHEAMEARLAALSAVEAELARTNARKDQDMQKVIDDYAPKLGELGERRAKLVDDIRQLWHDCQDELAEDDSKTAKFSSGQVSERMGSESVEINDPDLAMRDIRKHGLVRKLTVQRPREIVKSLLKEYRALVEGAGVRGVEYVRRRTLYISLADKRTEEARKARQITTRL